MAHVRVTVELIPDDEYGEADRNNQTIICATEEAGPGAIDRAMESAARRVRAAADAQNTVNYVRDQEDAAARDMARLMRSLAKLEGEIAALTADTGASKRRKGRR